MFDCGSNENIDESLLEIVRKEAEKADYILLSHATCMHVGALAYLQARGLRVKVIGTSPVAKIGAQTMHELYV
jgi:Cft2 family RNA processing exonuclease